MAAPNRILCVDDEPNVLRSLTRLFLDDGYEILTACSGAEGLLILDQRASVPVVVSDYRMPGMNGVEFLSEVRKRWPETVRIVLSGYADTAAVVSAINEGQIYRFIGKPWNDDELKTIVGDSLDRYALGRQNAELSEALRRKNDELLALKRDLELRVVACSETLTARNRLPAESLAVLDDLPIAIVGMDESGIVLQCNRTGMVRFGGRAGSVIGANRRDVLTAGQNRLVDDVLERRSRASNAIVSSADGQHLAVLGRDPHARDYVMLIAHEVFPDG
jgi:two-component system NtrC family sensor kinase